MPRRIYRRRHGMRLSRPKAWHSVADFDNALIGGIAQTLTITEPGSWGITAINLHNEGTFMGFIGRLSIANADTGFNRIHFGFLLADTSESITSPTSFAFGDDEDVLYWDWVQLLGTSVVQGTAAWDIPIRIRARRKMDPESQIRFRIQSVSDCAYGLQGRSLIALPTMTPRSSR